jgi:hypothetical protein
MTTYVPDDQRDLSVALLVCRPCGPSDTVPCHGRCAPGFYRNRLIASDTATGACARCTVNADCGTGHYALLCNGTGTSDSGCRACSPDRLRQKGLRVFVPYALPPEMATVVMASADDGYACPTACAANYVRTQDDVCVPCSSYVKDLMGCAQETQGADKYPGGQPRPCDFLYAHWNATPAPPWWYVNCSP